MRQNPELRSALSAVRVSQEEVTVARAGYLPSLGLGVIYGIDAPQFAVNGPDNVRNLGYSLAATLDIPVWDWLTTHDRVRQSEIRRDAARVALTSTQRQLVARLEEFYHEAVTASDQLASLQIAERFPHIGAKHFRIDLVLFSQRSDNLTYCSSIAASNNVLSCVV